MPQNLLALPQSITLSNPTSYANILWACAVFAPEVAHSGILLLHADLALDLLNLGLRRELHRMAKATLEPCDWLLLQVLAKLQVFRLKHPLLVKKFVHDLLEVLLARVGFHLFPEHLCAAVSALELDAFTVMHQMLLYFFYRREFYVAF